MEEANQIIRNVVKKLTGAQCMHVVERKDNFPPRYYQEDFLIKLASSWEHYKEFLLFAKCRAGKTYMTLKHVKDFGHKLTLIVSRSVSPLDSWKEGVCDHIDFADMVFINIKEKYAMNHLEIAMAGDSQVVLFSSIQNLQDKNLPYTVDFLVYDEADLGMGNPNQWKKVRSKVDCHILYITGTAYNMVNLFNDDQKFLYLYAQEQKDVASGLIDKRGKMKVVTPKFDVPGYEAIYGDDPDRITNLFILNEDKSDFLEPDLVRNFISKYFVNEGKHHKKALFYKCKHLYITLPGVTECHIFKEYLDSYRKCLVVTGETSEDQKSIVNFIEQNDKYGSCLLTYDANVRGVTTKKVDTVVVLNNVKSLARWNQFVFRGGSGSHDWLVVDFNESRTLSFMHEMMVIEAEETGAECAYNVTDFADVFSWEDGLTELSEEDVNMVLSSNCSDTTKLMSGLVNGMDIDIIKSIEFEPTLKPSKGDGLDITFGERNGNDKSAKNRKQPKRDSKEDQETIKKEHNHAKAILQRIPMAIAHNLMKYERSVLGIDSILESECYALDTEDHDGFLASYLDKDPEYYKRVNRRVLSVSRDIKASLDKNVSETLRELYVTTGKQRPMPDSITSKMLSR